MFPVVDLVCAASHALCRAIPVLILSAMVGGAIGVLLTYWRGQQWEASMLVQVGQIGSSSAPLVAPADLVNRVNFAGFSAQVCGAAGYVEPSGKDPRCRIVRKTLSARLPRSGNLVAVSVRDVSPDGARALAALALNILQTEHQAILEPSVTRLTNTLNDVNANIRLITESRAEIFKSVIKVAGTNAVERKFSENVLLSSLIKSDDSEVRALRQQKEQITEQLSNVRTFNTRSVAPVFVPTRPAAGTYLMPTILWSVLGMVLCAAVVLIRDPMTRAAASYDDIRDD